jgi:biopolymer transport protein ExbB
MNHRLIPLGLILFLLPGLASAWWNDEWKSRRQVTVDASATGADIQGSVADFPLLIRLHAGNFAYFAELAESGRDIRFLKDDKVALKHQVEKLDAFNELGLVWVRLPEVRGGVGTDAFWLYYGNPDAPEGSDAKGLYDAGQALVYHFAEGEALPQDATAYGSHAADSKATADPAGWIGAAAKFAGAGPVTVNPAPQLAVKPEQGWTFSAWVKIDQPQGAATLLEALEGGNGLELGVQGTALTARWQGPDGKGATSPVNLTPGKWQHVALVAQKDKLELYLDGAPVGSAPISLAALNPAVAIGRGFVGSLDEVQIASTARGADWIKLSFRTQSPDFAVLAYGQDEANGGGGDGHFMVIVQNVTVDGWVIIGLTGIMFIVAVIVMIVKSIVIRRITKDNKAFLAKYRELDAAHLGDLDAEDTDEDKELGESDLLTALVGKHDHFQSSTLYHLYHEGIRELKKLQGNAGQPVTTEAWNYLRVKLDSQVVRETQRLNGHMVLLTIAIAGGPFLGLLGTVVGVMITFAVIAATGDVNINSIAPGIAAALLATVAGLAVAIPALFAYNYLLTRIKDIVADMRVFTDEFLALLSMRVAAYERGVGGDGI